MSAGTNTSSFLDEIGYKLGVERSKVDFGIGLLTIVLLWQIAGMATSFFLPTFTETMVSFYTLFARGVIYDPLISSFTKMLIGFFISLIISLPVGLVMGASPRMRYLLDPYVNIMFATSVASILPLLIIVFGLASEFFIAVVVLFGVFHMILVFQAGVEDVNEELIEAAEVFGASQTQTYRHVRMPAALPFIVSGIRIGISRSFRGIVVAELWVLAGVGQLLMGFNDALQPDYALATIISLILIAVILVRGLYWIEMAVAPWRDIVAEE